MELNYQERLQAQLDLLKQTVKRPNVMILGQAGAGKSTLANLVFGSNNIKTGSGRSVTKGINYYKSEQKGIGIFDTQGYELGEAAEKEFYDNVVSVALNPAGNLDGEFVHLCWYCIPAVRERVQDIDVETIKTIRSAGIPIAVILTKSDLLSVYALAQLSGKLEAALPPNTPIFKSSKIKDIDAGEIDRICDWSCHSLDSSLRTAFTRAQIFQLQAKKDAAANIVKQSLRATELLAKSRLSADVSYKVNVCCLTMVADILYIYEMEEIEDLLNGTISDIAGKNNLVSLFSVALELVSEILGEIITEGTEGRVNGRLIGEFFSNWGHTGAAKTMVAAVGSTLIDTCASLAKDAIDGKTFDAMSGKLLTQKLQADIMKRLGN